MKLSNVISIFAFFGAAILVANSVYTSRKRNQEKENLRYALKHPLRAIDILSAPSSVDDEVLSIVMHAAHKNGRRLPDWAKLKLQKHIANFHSN